MSKYEFALLRSRDLGLLHKEDYSVIFIDLDILDNRLNHLKFTFPQNVLHAIAIKTNPLISVLKKIVDSGFGLEAASFSEVMMAKKAGAIPEKIVYDAPVKTREDLEFCNKYLRGIRINANSLSELSLYEGLKNIKIGLRINPMSGSGSNKLYDVSKPLSKFGEVITERKSIISAFVENPQLSGLHIHVGSQIGDLDLHINAIKKIYALAQDIETSWKLNGDYNRKIEYLDIGGGFPADYGDGVQNGLYDFVSRVKKECSHIFEKYKIITEYGRFIHAHTSWLFSKVSSQISNEFGNILLIHQGANMFVREVYTGEYQQRFFLFDQYFREKREGQKISYHIGGPLCFAGDIIAQNISLANVDKSDNLIISDIGANTFSLYSRHCSIRFPKVISYSSKSQSIQCIKKKESIDNIIDFWQ